MAKESNIKTFIFDIDGTLIDTYKYSLMALKQALYEIVGKSYGDKELAFHFGITLDDALKRLEIPSQYFDAISEKIDEIYYKPKERLKVFDGIEDMLKQLSNSGVLIGIVTSKRKTEFEQDFKFISIKKYFDIVICDEDTLKHKPNPEPIEKFIERSKSNKKNCIYIGDTLYDLEAAHSSGIKFGLAVWGALNNEIEADYFFDNPSDILKLLKKED
jgi:HAD superfamily hydrolase (TIGR01662 family)